MGFSHEFAIALFASKVFLARMYTEMSVEVVLQTKLFVAFLTLVRLYTRMNTHMRMIIAKLVKFLWTSLAFELLFAGMNPHVYLQMRLGNKLFTTHVTAKLLVVSVRLQVVIQVTIALENSRANAALEIISVAMLLGAVNSQVSFYEKTLLAFVTRKRLVVCQVNHICCSKRFRTNYKWLLNYYFRKRMNYLDIHGVEWFSDSEQSDEPFSASSLKLVSQMSAMKSCSDRPRTFLKLLDMIKFAFSMLSLLSLNSNREALSSLKKIKCIYFQKSEKSWIFLTILFLASFNNCWLSIRAGLLNKLKMKLFFST